MYRHLVDLLHFAYRRGEENLELLSTFIQTDVDVRRRCDFMITKYICFNKIIESIECIVYLYSEGGIHSSHTNVFTDKEVVQLVCYFCEVY